MKQDSAVGGIGHYDPLGRVIRTDFPDGTFSRVEFTPWESTSWDANDTVADSDWYAARSGYVGPDVFWQKERRAAELAFAHRDTPSKLIFDSLGRPFLGIEDPGGGATYETRVVLDIRGLPSLIIDARGNIAEQRTHGILGQVLETLGRYPSGWFAVAMRPARTGHVLVVDGGISVIGG